MLKCVQVVCMFVIPVFASVVLVGCQSAVSPMGNGVKTTYRVTDFGAKGDGVTDDTEAIQRCITAAGRDQIHYYKAESSYPEVIFPEGDYLITSPIVVAATETTRNLALRGEGVAKIIQANRGEDILYYHHGYRQTVDNLVFIGGHTQIRFFSRNMNRAQLIIRNCRFEDSAGYAIDDALKGVHHLNIVEPYTLTWVEDMPHLEKKDVDDLPDVFFTSTVLHIDQSEFILCKNVARLFADWGAISRSYIITHPEMEGAAIYSRGVLKISDTEVIAQTSQEGKQRFVDNINGGIMLDHVTLDSEGPGMTPV